MTSPVLTREVAGMAALHALCFDRPLDDAALAEWVGREDTLTLRIDEGEALRAFVIVQTLPDAGDILTIATHPGARRCGHARRLMEEVAFLLRERGLDRITLDVRADNHAAIAFYNRLGFSTDGRRKNYYRTDVGHVDAILMSRRA